MDNGGNSDDEWAAILEEADSLVQQTYANRSSAALHPPAHQPHPSQPPDADPPITNSHNIPLPSNPARPSQPQHLLHHHHPPVLQHQGPVSQRFDHQINYHPDPQPSSYRPSHAQNHRRDPALQRASQFRTHPQHTPSQHPPLRTHPQHTPSQNPPLRTHPQHTPSQNPPLNHSNGIHQQQQQQPLQPAISPHVPTQSPTARELAAAKGALENYKRKYQKIEQENVQLRSKLADKPVAAPPPDKNTPDVRTMTALKNDLAAARSAARKAEQRAEFAERELASRQEAAEFIEATQIQAPPLSQGVSMSRSTPRGPVMSQLPPTPSNPKRRRASVPLTSPREKSKLSSTPVRTSSSGKSKSGNSTSRLKAHQEEERDDADWVVENAAWLDAYDSETRKAERIRAMVLTPARVKVLTKVAARNRRLHNALQDALTYGNERVWKELAESLLLEHGSTVALETIVELHVNGAISLDENQVAIDSAIEVLKQEGANEWAFYILAYAGGASKIGDLSNGVAKIVHEGLLNGSVGAMECLAAHRNGENDPLEKFILGALQLVHATGAAAPGTRMKLSSLAAVERVPQLVPGSILSMLDDTDGVDGDGVVDRVGRIVAEVGAGGSDLVSLMKWGLVVTEKDRAAHGKGMSIWKLALDKILREWTEKLCKGAV